MIVHAIEGPPDAPLADALAAFESQFTYPLGPGRSFRISHGTDYAAFFRAMGGARCFVATDAGRVLGTIGVSLRELTAADGVGQRAAYVGDVKIAPAARGGVVLYRLARAADAWARPRAACAFGVVMDGTAALPQAYTGRAGVPAFGPIGTLSVRQLPSDEKMIDKCVSMSDADGMALYAALCSDRRAFATGGDPADRSAMSPQWIATPVGHACGRLEDTRRAKRLLVDDGTELSSAHLSCFAWRTPGAAAAVLAAARRRVAVLGFPAVFVAVDATDVAPLGDVIAGPGVTIAGATVYGVHVPADTRWSISSSEI